MKFCPWCGGSILDGAAFCVECGRDLPQKRQAEAAKAGKAATMPIDDEPVPLVTTFEDQPDGIPYKADHSRAADSAPTRQSEPREPPSSSDSFTEQAIGEPEEWQEEDEPDAPDSFSYYDDVPADAQAEIREGPDRKLILRIAMIGCAAAAVLLLAVLAMLYL